MSDYLAARIRAVLQSYAHGRMSAHFAMLDGADDE
jgi:hypothetical protein